MPNDHIIFVTKFRDNRLRIDWLDTEKLTFILDLDFESILQQPSIVENQAGGEKKADTR